MEHKSYSWQKSSLETDMQLIFDVFIINFRQIIICLPNIKKPS